MKKKKELPNIYFEDQEFLIDEDDEKFDEELILSVLGKNPSADQLLKFELCSCIENFIISNFLSLSQVEKLTGINTSDISRIKNHHIHRFTIDKLIKIYSLLDSPQAIGSILTRAGKKMSDLYA